MYEDRPVASTDIHQHLWPPGFFSALSARSEPPRLRGRALELTGEPPWDLNVESHELETRLAVLDRFGLERAVVSLQPTLGIDRLPADEARELLDTWEEGILELAGAAAGRILPLAAREPAPGFAGLCVSGADLLELDALSSRLDALTEYYAPQVRLYADFWSRLTGGRTRGGLFFVDGCVEGWVGT